MTTLASTIWNTLSRINVNDHIERKGKLTYLSWTWAWGKLMDHFPESFYYFEEYTKADGSMEVFCTMTIHRENDSVCRQMWLPVMDNRNQAIVGPNSRQISDAKMRCLVKTIGMFGLGFYIYAGEDLPAHEKEMDGPITDEQANTLKEMIKESMADMEKFCDFYRVSAVELLEQSKYEQAYNMLAKKIADSEASAAQEPAIDSEDL